MTFLQPLILWGLPLVLLPILIHLFNRLRHRPMPWAAMMFLRSATRKSTRYARLRQWLVLLLRVLALGAFILALSRPLAGGWMGWLASSTPDTILILLDRSASMEAVEPGTQISRRQRALELMGKTVESLDGANRVVLIDSATRKAHEMDSAMTLPEFPFAGPTDTAADLASLMQVALDWVAQNTPGSLEIWIASDLQTSNWVPESERWPALVAALQSLPQSVRLRLLALNRPLGNNRSLALSQVRRVFGDQGQELSLVADLQRHAGDPVSVPLTIGLNGVETVVDLKMETSAMRYRHRLDLVQDATSGWGHLTIPVDDLASDNRAFFVYGPPVKHLVAVVADDPFVEGVLALAGAPDSSDTNRQVKVFTRANGSSVPWRDASLVMWQGGLPGTGLTETMQSYVESGGVLLFFPDGNSASWEDQGWGQTVEAAPEQVLPVTNWESDAGPLADSESGMALPMEDLEVRRRQEIQGQAPVLASFADGAPFLTRRILGEGQILFCATLPRPDWSRLHDGSVLLPLISRLVQQGGDRFASALQLECGQESPIWSEGNWKALGNRGGNDAQLQAGVYRLGDRWLAVNRPEAEDDWQYLEPDQARLLFQGLSLRMFAEQEQGAASLQTALWRWFLLCMLAFLVLENFLILPEAGLPRRALS